MIDCHCHINHIKEIEEVLEESKKRKMLLINSALNVEEAEISFNIREQNSFFYVCVGLHPNDLDKYTDDDVDFKKHVKLIPTVHFYLNYYINK